MDSTSAQRATWDHSILTIESRYRWFGDPRFGRFQLYKDGRKVGRVEPKQALTLLITDGAKHRYQVRFWHWYRSEEIVVAIEEGQNLVMIADIDRSLSVSARMRKMGLHPRRSLTLRVVP